MAPKFLNKKGWHPGTLRNVEKVWKAEQKHVAEQKKLEELRKQIQEERDRSDLLRLQEQSNGIDRLEFLYYPGFAVVENQANSSLKSFSSATSSPAQKQQSSVPGALFEEKPAHANDAWRTLHSDPLFLIRKKEQEVITCLKNNPIQTGMIRKSGQETKKHSSSPQHNSASYSTYSRRKDLRRKLKEENPVKVSEEERNLRFLEMKMDAELLEKHRRKRLKKAQEDDAEETGRDGRSWGKNFLDGVQKSAYGMDAAGSCTVEERIRRLTYYLHGGSEVEEGKAFKR